MQTLSFFDKMKEMKNETTYFNFNINCFLESGSVSYFNSHYQNDFSPEAKMAFLHFSLSLLCIHFWREKEGQLSTLPKCHGSSQSPRKQTDYTLPFWGVLADRAFRSTVLENVLARWWEWSGHRFLRTLKSKHHGVAWGQQSPPLLHGLEFPTGPGPAAFTLNSIMKVYQMHFLISVER